jgi:hypothetical protein
MPWVQGVRWGLMRGTNKSARALAFCSRGCSNGIIHYSHLQAHDLWSPSKSLPGAPPVLLQTLQPLPSLRGAETPAALAYRDPAVDNHSSLQTVLQRLTVGEWLPLRSGLAVVTNPYYTRGGSLPTDCKKLSRMMVITCSHQLHCTASKDCRTATVPRSPRCNQEKDLAIYLSSANR